MKQISTAAAAAEDNQLVVTQRAPLLRTSPTTSFKPCTVQGPIVGLYAASTRCTWFKRWLQYDATML